MYKHTNTHIYLYICIYIYNHIVKGHALNPTWPIFQHIHGDIRHMA